MNNSNVTKSRPRPAALTPGTSPDAARLVEHLLAQALDLRASDIHFEPTDDPDTGLWVRVRLDGLLHDFDRIPRPAAESVVGRLKVLAGLLTYRIDIPQEGSLQLPRPAGESDANAPTGVQLRVATFPTIRGERVVVRVFAARSQVEQLDDLGFDPAQVARLKAAAESPCGMILLTGPAGAGKTTTLYALIRHVRDRWPERGIITVEDPVEQRIDRVTQIQINPHGNLDYETCMRSLLRQDPQVLLIGEIRDARTAAVAIDAALTGHLILTTIHGGDPAEAIVRLLEMGIPPYQVVSAVTVVCAQRLLRRKQKEWHGRPARGESGNPASFENQCHGDTVQQHYAGRVACGQVITINDELRRLILHHPTAAQLRAAMAGQEPDPNTRAARLVTEGITDLEEVHRVFAAATQ